MSALQTPIWANPSALPRPAQTISVLPTPVPQGLTQIKFSAVSVPSWPAAVGAFVTSFQISLDGGQTWPIGFGHSQDTGCPKNKDGSFAAESFVAIDLLEPTGPNTLIKGTITVGNPLPASGFSLSGQ